MLNKQVQAIYEDVKKMNRFATFITKSNGVEGYPFINLFIYNHDLEMSLQMYEMLKQKYNFDGVICGTEIMGGVKKQNY